MAPHPPRTDGRRRAGATATGAALVLLALVGCSSDAGSDAATTTTTETRATTTSTPSATTEGGAPDDAEGDCPAADDVADVVGGPVDDTSSGGGSAGDLTWSYQGCGYDLEDGDGSVGIARVTVDRSTIAADAADQTDFALLEADARAAFAEDGFEPIADLGDDAYRDGQGVAVRHGEQLFLVSIDGPDGSSDDGAEEDEGDEPAADARAVAVEVLDVDLGVAADQLCEPLRGAVDAALGASTGTRARTGSVGVDEVSFETVGCGITLADGRDVDIDVAPADDWEAWAEAKQASGFSETYEATSLGEVAAFTTEEGLFVDDGDRPLLVTSEDLGLGPEEEADLRVSLAELALGS